jgi:hypothetical protein
MARRKRTNSVTRRRHRGAGYSVTPSHYVAVGYPVNQPYTGAGKDCAANSFARPGFISSHSSNGIPGMSGGSRRRKNRSRGGYVLAVAPSDAPSQFPDNVSVPVGAPGVPPHTGGSPSTSITPTAVKQAGGRYEFTAGAVLDPVSGIGMSSYAPINSIACERGTSNSMNPNPAGIQQLTTAVQRGGSVPTVAVGAADSMRVYAPTAGYGHQFETLPASSAVGGLMLNTPYDARAFNAACTKTGGGNIADHASAYAGLDMKDVTGRGGFDGSNGLLPMKYGGTRRKHRKHRKQRKSRTSRKSRKQRK